MLSCCFGRAVGSGTRKPRKETFCNRCRRWLNPPPRRRSLLARVFRRPQGTNVSAAQNDQQDTRSVRAWEMFMKRMAVAVAEGDQSYASLLVLNYRGFFTIQQVLDRVSNRYASSCNWPDRDGGGQEGLKNTFSCLLLTWLQDFPSDFDEPPDFSSLKELVSFAQVVLPGSALESQAQDRLFWLERSVASETQTQGLVPLMAAKMVSDADLKAPVAAPAMPPADVEPPWHLTVLTSTPEREAALRPPALPPSEAVSSPDQELRLEMSPALPAEQAVFLRPPQLPPSGPKPVAPVNLTPAAAPPEAPTEQQEADRVPLAVRSVELQSAPGVTPPGDHCCSSRGHREQGLREGKAPILAFPARLQAEQLSQIDVGYKYISRLECIQEGYTCTNFCNMEELKAWFGAVDQLRESECYHLSREREPLALLASNTLDAPILRDAVKPRSAGPQEFSAEPSCSGASLPSVCIQLRCDLSSGVAALSLPGCEADASQAHSEMSVGLMSTCPDGQEKQPQGTNVSAAQNDQQDTRSVRAWEKFMERMVAAVAEGNQTYVSLLVLNYWGSFFIQQVLDRVSNSTFSCLLLTWLQEFPDDFCESPDFSSLKELVSFVQVALPGSALERQAQVLLS
ncbi:uncharacterized protein LOC143681053 isoform X3 [Tamandua tetradactyla]|uniref:uncharacterized protein LOC143681053 isoform X3 n=1 Tax=Tamandua tetradactyla TaxID=48850 RepID=UPI0040542F15